MASGNDLSGESVDILKTFLSKVSSDIEEELDDLLDVIHPKAYTTLHGDANPWMVYSTPESVSPANT